MAFVLSRLQHPRRWRTRRWLRRLRNHRSQLTVAAVLLAIPGVGWSSGWFSEADTAAVNSSEVTPTNATPSSGELVALELISHPAAFANALFEFDQSLTSIAERPYPESLALRTAGDSWTENLMTTDAAVTRLEESWPVGPDSSSTPDSLKGETP